MFSGADKDIGYLWLLCISFIGGILSFFNPKNNNNRRFSTFIIGLISSMYAAYIVFEIINYFFAHEKIAIALAGIAAWMGTDALLVLEESLRNKLQKK